VLDWKIFRVSLIFTGNAGSSHLISCYSFEKLVEPFISCPLFHFFYRHYIIKSKKFYINSRWRKTFKIEPISSVLWAATFVTTKHFDPSLLFSSYSTGELWNNLANSNVKALSTCNAKLDRFCWFLTFLPSRMRRRRRTSSLVSGWWPPSQSLSLTRRITR
jgi:hypothetical protein